MDVKPYTAEEVNDFLAPMIYTNTDLAPQMVRVEIGDKKYWLVEGDAETVMAYKNAQTKGAKLLGKEGSDDTTVQFSDSLNDSELALVAGCLCLSNMQEGGTLMRDGTGKPKRVGLEAVKGFLYHIQKGLYERSKAITRGLDEKETVASVEKQIAKLQVKLAKLKETPDPLGKSSSGGPAPSASVSA